MFKHNRCTAASTILLCLLTLLIETGFGAGFKGGEVPLS